MRKFLLFLACSIGFGCTATLFAADPNSTLPPLSSLKLPKPDCNCMPCICDPAKCTCANCANGCKKTGSSQSAATEQVAFVGSDPFQTEPTVETSQSTTPQGYHVEYRKVCNGTSCQMVRTLVRDIPDAPNLNTVPVYSGCASCQGNGGSYIMYGSGGGCSGGSCSSGSYSGGSCGRSGPIRRILGIFRRR